MVVELGSAVLRHACRDAVGWLARLGDRAPRSVSVNLSARQIQRGDVVEVVRSALQDSGLPPQALTLEVTESVLLEDVDHAVRTLAALKALGVRMALDDFGTGYSSLSYLDRFPVDIVKIDKTFIDSLAGTAQPSTLVSALVNLGTMLGRSEEQPSELQSLLRNSY